MAKEEKVHNFQLEPVQPTSPEGALAELLERGYDAPAICSYAKAARSWCEKDSHDWSVWKAVETMTSSSK